METNSRGGNQDQRCQWHTEGVSFRRSFSTSTRVFFFWTIRRCCRAVHSIEARDAHGACERLMALRNTTSHRSPTVTLDISRFVFLSLLSSCGRKRRFLLSKSTDAMPEALPSNCFALTGLLRTSKTIDMPSIVRTSPEVVVA